MKGISVFKHAAPLCLAVALFVQPAVQAASDSAASAAYNDDWQNGDNGGTGFTPWIVSLTTGGVGISTATVGTASTYGGDATQMDTAGRSFLMNTFAAGILGSVGGASAWRNFSTAEAPLGIGSVTFRAQSRYLSLAEGSTSVRLQDDIADVAVLRSTGSTIAAPAWVLLSASTPVNTGFPASAPVEVTMTFNNAAKTYTATVTRLDTPATFGPVVVGYVTPAATKVDRFSVICDAATSDSTGDNVSLIFNGPQATPLITTACSPDWVMFE